MLVFRRVSLDIWRSMWKTLPQGLFEVPPASGNFVNCREHHHWQTIGTINNTKQNIMSFRAGYPNPNPTSTGLRSGEVRFFRWFSPRRWKGAATIQQILKTHWSLLNRLRMVGLARFLRFKMARKQQEMTEDLRSIELELKIWSNMFGWWGEFLTNVKPSESSVFSWEWKAHWLWRLPCTQPNHFEPNISRTMIWTLRMVFKLKEWDGVG